LVQSLPRWFRLHRQGDHAKPQMNIASRGSSEHSLPTPLTDHSLCITSFRSVQIAPMLPPMLATPPIIPMVSPGQEVLLPSSKNCE
jgi:hypothetical protein